MRSKVKNTKLKFLLLFCGLWIIACGLCGCEAFVRKFTRKPKGEPNKEMPVLQPEVYPDVASSRDQLYKDYFLFWETWVDELLSNLSEKANVKKQKECANEALDNLLKMRSLLNDEKAKTLEPFIAEFTAVKNTISAGRPNGADFYYLRNKLERIKSKVHRNFIFSKIKKDLS